jgi:hypothetical protein
MALCILLMRFVLPYDLMYGSTHDSILFSLKLFALLSGVFEVDVLYVS